jgi:hypothetical protein
MRLTVIAMAGLLMLPGACKSEEEEKAEALVKALGNLGEGLKSKVDQAASAAAKAMLGDSVPAHMREQIAKAASSMAQNALKGMPNLAAAGAARKPTPALTPAEEAGFLAKLDLGAKGDFFPAELKTLKFGMSGADLKAARPHARMGKPWTSQRKGKAETRLVALEDGAPDGPWAKFSYHFENDGLRAVFATLRLTSLSEGLLEKAKAKWGPWRGDLFAAKMEEFYVKRGGGMKEWRLPAGRVKLEQNGIEPQAKFYFAR